MNFDDYLKSDQAKEKMKELNSERKDIFKTDSINGINSSNVFNESFDRQLQKVSGEKISGKPLTFSNSTSSPKALVK